MLAKPLHCAVLMKMMLTRQDHHNLVGLILRLAYGACLHTQKAASQAHFALCTQSTETGDEKSAALSWVEPGPDAVLHEHKLPM